MGKWPKAKEGSESAEGARVIYDFRFTIHDFENGTPFLIWARRVGAPGSGPSTLGPRALLARAGDASPTGNALFSR